MSITGKAFSSFGLLVSLVGLGAQSPDTPRITVFVYNYAAIPPDVLVKTETETARIYQLGGIEIQWLDCPLSPPEASRFPECQVSPRPTTLALRLLSQSMAERAGQAQKCLGFAPSPDNGSFATIANVFAHEAEQLAKRRDMPQSVILAHLMAHEMGHLLLGDNSHSVNGIMHIPWRPKELEIIREGRMAFMPEEAAAMRVNVRGRIHAAQATQAVLLPGPRMVANWPHTSVDTSYSVPIGSSSNREPASAPRLTVVIYDHVHVGPEALIGAENTVSEIFARADVQLIWRDGFAYAAERRAALNPLPEDPATLVVKLQPESEAARYGVRSVCGGIGFPSGAIVFVRSLDATRLGYVMAHELGHILLGPNAHALVGIMRGTLLPADWEKAAQATLGFTHSQNQQIRMWIDQRSRR